MYITFLLHLYSGRSVPSKYLSWHNSRIMIWFAPLLCYITECPLKGECLMKPVSDRASKSPPGLWRDKRRKASREKHQGGSHDVEHYWQPLQVSWPFVYVCVCLCVRYEYLCVRLRTHRRHFICYLEGKLRSWTLQQSRSEKWQQKNHKINEKKSDYFNLLKNACVCFCGLGEG